MTRLDRIAARAVCPGHHRIVTQEEGGKGDQAICRDCM